ncbi:MAG: hypothetical protein COU25_00160 [Candidatus Levybacteria bacterium CG10_big_fil_rev_8_21_14_0_10_35_13]|nr:MAG: hypothetical protein COU25_00160 [Candidatus Levybacteria bacterium CG10_big_fil_rev_8_21_14_0_10_35_13]
MKILILTGGNSSERRISFLSAKNVKNALIENGHKVKVYDLRKGYESIKKISKDFDFLFPVLHGEEGEGGILHKYLSTIKKPIVGTRNYKGFEKGWYKIPFKKFCDKNGIKTAPWKVVKSKKDIFEFDFPCVLKASGGGSSREVIILKSKKDVLRLDIKKILNLTTSIFVERYFPGIEVTVGILNNKALPAIEIIPAKGEWFSYKNKYASTTKEIPFAPSLTPKQQILVQKIALKIHKSFKLGTYSRSDFIVYKNVPYVLEVNTIPGLTAGSLIPKAAKAAGISFNNFVEILLKNAK